MSQVVEWIEYVELPDLPPVDLPEEDGEPMETNWHRLQMNLLIEIVAYQWRDRRDFFVGGNMFIYYSLQQVRNKDYKGPDFFVVKGVDGSFSRPKWVVWEENGRYPNVIIELMSPSTRAQDLGQKKTLYEQTFHTPEYFCYDPYQNKLYGWRLVDKAYEEITPNEDGRLWSSELDGWLGLCQSSYLGTSARYLRLFDMAGELVPIAAEAAQKEAEAAQKEAEAAQKKAETAQREAEAARKAAEAAQKKTEVVQEELDAERERAQLAEAEIARLQAELAALRHQPPAS
jgi:Uma2 family endonuclease